MSQLILQLNNIKDMKCKKWPNIYDNLQLNIQS